MPTKKFRPKKSFGQNFLKNPRVIETILRAAELQKAETVLEVGPGYGVLTRGLLAHAGHVIAIEKDDHLYDFLAKEFASAINAHDDHLSAKLTLIHDDALKIPPPTIPYVWVANIPYSITSPLLDHFIRENPDNLPRRAVLLVQKEVAEKLCARVPDMNVLALHVQTFGTAKIISKVAAANFDPKPKVDSAIIQIDFDKKDFPKNLPAYFDLIHKAFSQKRKMLRATLSKELLHKAGIDETRRPETLSIEEWQILASHL